jgi:hypothetical protein
VTLRKLIEDARGALPEGGIELINASVLWVQDKTDSDQNKVFQQVRDEEKLMKQLVRTDTEWLETVATEIDVYEGKEEDPDGIIAVAV